MISVLFWEEQEYYSIVEYLSEYTAHVFSRNFTEDEARRLGYKQMKLDVIDSFREAIELYRS